MATTNNMTISGIRNSQNRASIKAKSIENQVKSLAKTTLESSKDVFLDGSLSNNQILQYKTNVGSGGGFTNIDVSAAGIQTAYRAKEFFVKAGGSDSNTGNSTSFPYSTFQKAVSECSKTDSLDAVSIYVTGNVVWDSSSNRNRLRESSFGGNLSRGLIIRGLRDSLAAIAVNSPPRVLQSQLQSITTVASLSFTKQTAKGHGTTVVYSANAPQDTNTVYYKTPNGTYYPVTFDGTQNSNNQTVYLSDNSAIPSEDGSNRINVEMLSYKYSGKVTMNNSATTSNLTNTGFSMDGNVQFVEVEFVLQKGVVTPYTVNGSFQILYSKFSKTGNSNYYGDSSETSTLQLCSYGENADHLSTLQVNLSANVTAGGTVLQVYKSVFLDLVIKIDSPALIRDCVFRNCIISNPHGARFEGCTFYHTTFTLGDTAYTNSIGCSASINTSQFVYGRVTTDTISQFKVANAAELNVNDLYLTPMGVAYNTSPVQVTSAQTVPLFRVSGQSTLTANNLRFPVSGNGVNVTGDTASLIHASDNSNVWINGTVLTKTSGTNPLIVADSCNLQLSTFDNACDVTGEMLVANQSRVTLNEFVNTSAKFTVTSATSGVLNFRNCDVTVAKAFSLILEGTVSTTVNAIMLNNSTFRNHIVGADGYFNLQNDPTQLSITGHGSAVNIDLETTASNQLDIHGGMVFTDSNVVLKTDGTSSHKLADTRTTGHALKLTNTDLIMRHVDITSDAGSGATGTTSVLEADSNCNITLDTIVSDVIGKAGVDLITLTKGCKLHANAIAVAGLSNCQSILNLEQSSAVINGSTLLGTADATQTVNVSRRSSLDMTNTLVSSANDRCLHVTQSSTAVVAGTGAQKLAATNTTGTSDEVVLVSHNSDLELIDITLEGAPSGNAPTGVKAMNNCRVALNSVAISVGKIAATHGVLLLSNSKLHAEDMGAGFTAQLTLGSVTSNWSALASAPKILPSGATLSGDVTNTWNNFQGTSATYT